MKHAFLSLSLLVAFSAGAVAQQSEQAQQSHKLELCPYLRKFLQAQSLKLLQSLAGDRAAFELIANPDRQSG